MSLMLIYATCPICYELQTPDHLTRDERGLCCRDRAACLRRKAVRLALLPRKEPA